MEGSFTGHWSASFAGKRQAGVGDAAYFHGAIVGTFAVTGDDAERFAGAFAADKQQRGGGLAVLGMVEHEAGAFQLAPLHVSIHGAA